MQITEKEQIMRTYCAKSIPFLAFLVLTNFGQSLFAAPSCGAVILEGSTIAEQLIKKLNDSFSIFFRDSGFENEKELLIAVNDPSTPEYYRTAKDLLMNEKLEVVIATPEKYRDVILASQRLKNSHETSKSEGSLMHDRNAAEAAYLHMPYEEYTLLNNSFKAKYGYLRAKTAAYEEAKGVWSYGKDRFILKLEKIRDRLTLSLGDSLNFVALTMNGSEVTLDMNTWDSFFVPWSQRALFIPFLGQGIGYNQHVDENYLSYAKEYSLKLPKQELPFKAKIGLPIQTFLETENSLSELGLSSYVFPVALEKTQSNLYTEWTNQNQDFPMPLPTKLKNFKHTHNWSLDYIEAQIWGELTFEDVAAFEYTDTKPPESFLNSLRAKGIEVRDGRKK